jgi:hypothetical protein
MQLHVLTRSGKLYLNATPLILFYFLLVSVLFGKQLVIKTP